MAWFGKPVHWLYFTCGVLLAVSLPHFSQGFSFYFYNPPAMFYSVGYGQNYQINCTTNDTKANTTLHLKTSSGVWVERVPKPGEILKEGDVYTIVDFGIPDSGQYKCRAINEKGQMIQWSDMNGILIGNPGYIPDVNIAPSYAIVMTAGQSINITCSSSSHVVLTWYKQLVSGVEVAVPNDKTISHVNSADKSVHLIMMFKNSIVADTGTYKCLMTFQGKKNYKYASVTVFENKLPSIKSLSGSTSPIVIQSPAQTDIVCVAEGHPAPTIHWYKDNKELTVDGCVATNSKACEDSEHKIQFINVLKFNENKGILTILKTSYPEDHGTYTCKAANSIGDVKKTIFVDVQVKPSIVQRKDPFFGVVTVNCKIAHANPGASFTWEYEKWPCFPVTNCPADESKWKPLPKMFIVSPTSGVTNSSSVTFKKDLEDSYFRCTATNKFGSSNLTLTFRRVEGDQEFVKIKTSRKETTAYIAGMSPIRIKCRAVDQLALYGLVRWLKDGQLLAPYTDPRVNITFVKMDERFTNIFLTVVNTTVNDSGVYTCDPDHFQAPGNDSIPVLVRARVSPNITGLASQEVYVKEEKDLTLELACDAPTALPKPEIAWYSKDVNEWKEITQISANLFSKEGCRRRTNDFYYYQEKIGSPLVICKPRHLKNTRWYKCVVRNIEGSDEKVFKVNVLAKAAIQGKEDKKVIETALGTNVNISCRALGNPVPDVVWTRTKDSTREVLQKGKGYALLLLKNIQSNDLGNYTCNATNYFTDLIVFTIKVKVGGYTNAISGLKSEVLVGIICGCVAFVLVIIVILILYRRQKKQMDEYKELYFLRTGNADYKIDPDRSLLEQCNNLPYDMDWEFPEERLVIGKVLGSGAFGQVLKAEAIGMPAFNPRDKNPDALKRRSKLRRSMRESRKKNEYASMRVAKQTVAVKCLKDGATQSDYKDLASELKILIHLGEHRNIVNVLGACTRGRRLLLIIEFAPHGDLLSFLRGKRDIFDPNWVKTSNNPDQEFTLVDLAMAVFQVSRGMEFLASRKCVHRDMAARNVLVGKDFIMKISDFGLARDIYQDDLYVKTTSGLLPVKWMAMESLFDRVYTEKSDVWSFGIMLWEVFTLGGTPYPGLPTEQLLDYLSEGQRMQQPQNCPLEMYAIMRDCWMQYPEQRPNFESIAQRLGTILEKNVTKDNPYIQFEMDDESGAASYYLNPCDLPSRQTPDGYEEALPTPKPDTSKNYNTPLPSVPGDDAPDSPGYDKSHSPPLPTIPPSYEEATTKRESEPRNASESSNESGIGIDDKEKGRNAEREPLIVEMNDDPNFAPGQKKGKRAKTESTV